MNMMLVKTWAFLHEKLKKVDFSETIEACDLKVDNADN